MVLNMKLIIFLSVLVTFLMANNPAVYATLGDVIYDNAVKIEKLRTIDEYSPSSIMIDKYLLDVKKTKELGFKLESGDKTTDAKGYLIRLRQLSKINDLFVRRVYKLYKESLKNEDSWLLSKMINSGLMDTQKYKDEILDYYFKHSDMMDSTGIIDKFLQEKKKSKELKEVSKKKIGLSKEEIQKARIQRLRRNDRLKQEAMQKSLEAQVAHEKHQIRQEQLRELSK